MWPMFSIVMKGVYGVCVCDGRECVACVWWWLSPALPSSALLPPATMEEQPGF